MVYDRCLQATIAGANVTCDLVVVCSYLEVVDEVVVVLSSHQVKPRQHFTAVDRAWVKVDFEHFERFFLGCVLRCDLID